MNALAEANVLVVDDERDLRELLCDALAGEGLCVSTAATSAEACALAEGGNVDLVIADVRLPDGSGLEVIDRLRRHASDLPAVLITGATDASLAGEAARRGCVDFLTKPLDLPRLRQAVRRELTHRQADHRTHQRLAKYRRLTRHLSRRRREARWQLEHTCAGLSKAYRALHGQFCRQETGIRFMRELLACRNDDDIFRGLFSLFSKSGGSLFGIALVCDQQAKLQMVGRFGMPAPDSVNICQEIADSLMPTVLNDPEVLCLEAEQHLGLFPPALHERLTGVSFLLMPLMPASGELIGLAVLYRKGEQPFTNDDLELAALAAPCAALRLQTTECPEKS